MLLRMNPVNESEALEDASRAAGLAPKVSTGVDAGLEGRLDRNFPVLLPLPSPSCGCLVVARTSPLRTTESRSRLQRTAICNIVI